MAAVREIENTLDASPLRRAAALAEGSIDVYQVRVGDSFAALGKPLREVTLPPAVMIAAIQRGPQTFVPNADDTVLTDDRLLVIGTQNLEKVLTNFFAVV